MLLTKNAVFIKLFAALITFVLLKFFYIEGRKKNNCKHISFTDFKIKFCLPILGADITLDNEEFMPIFNIHWDIEVVIKRNESLLNISK